MVYKLVSSARRSPRGSTYTHALPSKSGNLMYESHSATGPSRKIAKSYTRMPPRPRVAYECKVKDTSSSVKAAKNFFYEDTFKRDQFAVETWDRDRTSIRENTSSIVATHMFSAFGVLVENAYRFVITVFNFSPCIDVLAGDILLFHVSSR